MTLANRFKAAVFLFVKASFLMRSYVMRHDNIGIMKKV